MTSLPLRAVSSVGRASRLHREGQRFEPVTAHHTSTENRSGGPISAVDDSQLFPFASLT